VYVYPDIADAQAVVDSTTSAARLEAIANDKKTAVLLPAAYYLSNLMQLPPIPSLRERQIPMALATGCDPLSMPATSILLVLNMACRLFGFAPHEALHGLTSKAAQAIGVSDDMGMLMFGKIADLALWDIKHPSELSYHLGRNPCMGVFKSGVLYKLEG
jgi:imidazolonepropionase